MSTSSPGSATVIPAATVVIFRDARDGGAPELLMVQRARNMRFAGGAAVFPGGKVDPEDQELAKKLAPDADPEDSAARIAAIRETLEETGLMIGTHQAVQTAEVQKARAILEEKGALAAVLDHFGWTLALESLFPFARWCPQQDRSFDARFFLANLGTGAVDITVDATENTRLFWVSAAKALELAGTGDLSIIFPTQCNLQRLAQFSTFTEARLHSESIPVRMITPEMVERDGETWLTIPEGCGYPVTGQPMASVLRGLKDARGGRD